MKNITFITGAVRSGKSLLAEEFATKQAKNVYYLASMQILDEDEEQLRRLELHRRRRPVHWETIDSPFRAHEIVNQLPAGESVVIFDCLSLYITNMLITCPQNTIPTQGFMAVTMAPTVDSAIAQAEAPAADSPEADPYLKEAEVLNAVESLVSSMIKRDEIQFIIVSNEVGWGVVPETKLGRAFRDFLGLANQMVAAAANNVYLCCSGLRLQLK